MHTEFSVAAHWNGGFEERALQVWAAQVRGRLRAPQVSLGLVFLTPRFFSHATQVLEILRVHAQIPLLVGCSSNSLISGDQEIEDTPGLALGLYGLPGAELGAFHFTQEQAEECNGPGYWHLETGIGPDQTNGWLVFADPFHLDAESWLRGWNEAYAPLPVLGGLASGDYTQQIGNRPAYEVLAETFNRLSPDEQKKARGNLFVGLVINEYLEDFQRGDFLVLNLLGADPLSGAIAVGALPRPGQTLQFQRRDAAAAPEDMLALLARAKQHLDAASIY